MIKTIQFVQKTALICLVFLLISYQSRATHIYGADFYYTYVNDTTYNVTLVVYGDCGGSAFPNLSTGTPTVELYNGTTLVETKNLAIQAPSAGVEVTPVCPSQLSNTNCVSSTGTIPGVKRFTYTGTFILNSTSANWRFRFTGAMGFTSSAGRSTTITNITSGTGGGTIMALEATLNNTIGGNSSPIYTSIPTPFFCINVPANNNPGTVDPNLDALSYSLVPGMVNTGGTVTYVTGYTATAPLAVATGTFSFSSSTGQLSFTPNLVQRSLVVFRVDEYRGSTLVGTSMREMTFVVLNNCTNNAPTGSISSQSAGTISGGGTTLTVCKSAGLLTFNINATDAEGNAITMTPSGIPAGATYTITNNNTTAPTSVFSWNLATATPGTYNFFINFKDDGCPLSSSQTRAYTITILPDPALAYTLLSPATCSKKARFTMTPSVAPSPWTITIRQGTSIIHTFTGLTGAQTDSLDPGTYTIRVTNNNTCFKDTTITLNPPPTIIPTVSMVRPTCFGGSNGSITLVAGGGVSPFTYAIGTGSFGTSNIFTGLTAGSYTLRIRDANDCIKDTTVQLQNPPDIVISVASTKPRCNFYSSGLITVTASNGTSPYQYALGTGSFSSTNTFSGLFSGTYLIRVRDNNNCTKDSNFVLNDSISVHANAVVTNVLCNGDNTGAIVLTGNSGTAPYFYRLLPGTFGTSGTFNTLPAAVHNFRIKDVDSCYLDTAIAITQPARLASNINRVNVSCFGLTNGSVTVTGTGGVSPYTYAIGTGSFASVNSFTGLAPGTYTFRVKDANDCIRDTSITITQPAKLGFSNISITEPICNGNSNGIITISGTGGTTPFTYAIGSSAYVSSSTFSGLAAGTYILRIRDANNCDVDSTVTMNQPTRIIPSLQVKQSTCTPLNNGNVIISVSGGVPGYVYAIGTSSFGSANVYGSLAAGTYTFYIRDTRLCVKDTTITIIDSTRVNANYTINNVRCFGDTNASISIATTSGQSPFTYSLNTNPFVPTNTFSNLPIGSYTVAIRDNLGCRKDTSITITQPSLLVPFISITPPTCYGFANGRVIVGAFGGTPAFNYAMGTGAFGTSGTFNNMLAGTYTFRVRDANNCSKDTTITVTEPARLGYQNLDLQNVLCFGDTSGKVTITGIGGITPYTYAINSIPHNANNIKTGLKSGIHIVRIKDANNCERDTVITLTQPNKLLLTVPSVIQPTCEDYKDATIVVSGLGGTLPYMYSINNGSKQTNNIFNQLTQGNYILTVTDSNNCEHDTSLTLQGYPRIIISDAIPKAASCFGFNDGKITLTVTGGVQPLMYQLDSRTPVSVSTFFDLAAGTYKVRVIDDKNCIKDTAIRILQPDKLTTTIKVVPNDCEGYDDGGYLKADVTGGTMPYLYKWSANDNALKEELSNMANGKYMVWITDANTCKDSAGAEVLYNDCCNIFIPDAFTPNGDGRNDKAKVLFKGDFVLQRFAIYNRFGQQVFETNIIGDGWDGVYNGKLQDIGTYNYYAKGICGNGGKKEVEYKGTLTLIR